MKIKVTIEYTLDYNYTEPPEPDEDESNLSGHSEYIFTKHSRQKLFELGDDISNFLRSKM